ncbi:hypothetical protein M495_14495 [Serratia liquefaciens ATCC 27592]|uniref:hypothetical protein n=1 Tax=Serratia liquefaciens TaxID=614 RepID=UPI0003585BEC|nr:hypothetical protein [Serratia liquefaciens]AGQ31626.1 hypothetical protein M495_14495 [Serratia liquefaciens ATCC 27592]
MDKLHEDSRKQFEEVAANDRSELEVFKRGPLTGEYKNPVVQKMWKYWQASRASIVVELPNGLTTREALDLGYMGDYASGVDDGIEESAKVLRSIGLSIKGESECVI